MDDLPPLASDNNATNKEDILANVQVSEDGGMDSIMDVMAKMTLKTLAKTVETADISMLSVDEKEVTPVNVSSSIEREKTPTNIHEETDVAKTDEVVVTPKKLSDALVEKAPVKDGEEKVTMVQTPENQKESVITNSEETAQLPKKEPDNVAQIESDLITDKIQVEKENSVTECPPPEELPVLKEEKMSPIKSTESATQEERLSCEQPQEVLEQIIQPKANPESEEKQDQILTPEVIEEKTLNEEETKPSIEETPKKPEPIYAKVQKTPKNPSTILPPTNPLLARIADSPKINSTFERDEQFFQELEAAAEEEIKDEELPDLVKVAKSQQQQEGKVKNKDSTPEFEEEEKRMLEEEEKRDRDYIEALRKEGERLLNEPVQVIKVHLHKKPPKCHRAFCLFKSFFLIFFLKIAKC